MNDENRATKLYLKSLAPLEVTELLSKYKIPSPYKEVIVCACIYRKEGFAGCDMLAEYFNIHISYWTFGRRLKEALKMFRKSHIYSTK